MLHIKIKLMTLLAILIMQAQISHAVVVWDESLNGDLPETPSSLTLLFDDGISDIVGTTSTALGTSETDSFQFQLRPDQILNSMIIRVWDTTRPDLTFGVIFDGSQSVQANPANIGLDLLPFHHQFPVTGGLHTFRLSTGAFQVHYQFEFVTSTIPIPAASYLMITGLIGLMGFSRQRTQAAT